LRKCPFASRRTYLNKTRTGTNGERTGKNCCHYRIDLAIGGIGCALTVQTAIGFVFTEEAALTIGMVAEADVELFSLCPLVPVSAPFQFVDLFLAR
jgi:hypothetical protein